MIKVGIIGASGYTGGELLRFLKNHPEIDIVAATSRQFKGESHTQSAPTSKGLGDEI